MRVAVGFDFDTWLAWVFDHPVRPDGKEWYWTDEASAFDPEARPRTTVEYLARLFEAPELLIERYTPDQIGQGIWFLASNALSNHAFALLDDRVPWDERRRALAAIAPLYERLFARICAPRLGHRERSGDPDPAGRASQACYMFWDIAPIGPGGRHDETCLDALERTLAIPHAACQEAALHGLGHWQHAHPARVATIVDAYLARERGLPEELATYAKSARGGCVL